MNSLQFNTLTKWLSWLSPTTLDGDVLYYILSVIVTKLNIINYTANSTTTNISLSHINFVSCQRYELIVVPVNIVGEGQNSSQEYYHIGGKMFSLECLTLHCVTFFAFSLLYITVPGVEVLNVAVSSNGNISANITYKV